MDYFPENVLLEITALLNEPQPPLESGKDLAGFGIALSVIRQIWWLECFLQRGPEVFRETFQARPAAEQQDLALQVFRWFLYRPRLRRLFPTRPGTPAGAPWELTRGGSLVSLAGEEKEGTAAGIYYVFPHSRIWPDLLDLLDWPAFLNPAERLHLEADLAFADRSRLDGSRDRSARLRSLLTRPEPVREVKSASPAEEAIKAPPVRPAKKPAKKKGTAGQLRLFE
jgi:hypothetical protein